MSGRIRTIKPELLEDAITAGLSDMAFRLFIACILVADDYGRLRYEPGWLRGQVYWSRDVEREAFLDALAELEPLVMAYTVKGQRYAAIRNWAKHQRVDKPGKPRLPVPPAPSNEAPETLANVSRDSREGLAPDLRSPISDLDPEEDLSRARASETPVELEPAPSPPPTSPPVEKPDTAPLELVISPEVTLRPEVTPPTTATPPSWFATAAETAAMAIGGDVAELPARWASYRSSRSRKGWAMSHEDAVGWLCDVVRRERASQQRDASGPRLTVVRPPEPPPAPYHCEARLARPGVEPDAPPSRPRVVRVRPPDEAVREAARRLAAGVFG